MIMSSNEIATRIYNKYRTAHGCKLPTFVLQALLFAVQKEAVRKGDPLFTESFTATKDGPKMLGLDIHKSVEILPCNYADKVVDTVIRKTYGFPPYEMMQLFMRETAWKKGMMRHDHRIDINDIVADAKVIKRVPKPVPIYYKGFKGIVMKSIDPEFWVVTSANVPYMFGSQTKSKRHAEIAFAEAVDKYLANAFAPDMPTSIGA